MEKLFFFHNPKCGGTSLIESIRVTSPNATISPLIENNTHDHERLHGNYSSFKGYDIYAGHYGRDVFDQVRNGHRYFSNFRHPVSRIVSLYKFFRSLDMPQDQIELPHHLAVRAAKAQSIQEFVENESKDVQIYVRNAHFRQLTSTFYEIELKSTLSEAFDFMDGMIALYICEHPQASEKMFQSSMGIRGIPRLNVAFGTENMLDYNSDTDLCKSILSRNELDLAVYDYACSLMQRCIQSSPSARPG